MAIEKVRDFFGIKYLIPYNRTTKKPLVVLRVIGELNFTNDVEEIKLVGGHSEGAHDVEFGQPEQAITATVREYPAELFSLMETCTVTEFTAAAGGALAASPTNGQGTSVIKSLNGISTINIVTAADLVFGQYVLVATSATTLDLYINGLVNSFDNVQGRVVSGITTSAAGTVQVSGYGISLTVVGTPNYTVGDTAYVDIRPINTGATKVVVGSGTVPSNFGCRCIFPRKTDGVLHYIDIPNIAGRGLNWGSVSREFSETEINWTPLVDTDGTIYTMFRVLGS